MLIISLNFLATHLALIAAGSNGKPEIPLSPLGLQASEIKGRSITLKWDQPPRRLNNDADVFMYHIFFRETDSTRYYIIKGNV